MAENELNEVPAIDEAPWLIGLQENDDDVTLEQQTFFSMNNNTSYVKKIVELQGKSIVGSSVGWLILRDRVNETMYSLWNPITRQSITLPELLGKSHVRGPEWCFLTSPPYEDGFDSSKKCFVLIILSGVVFSCRITTKKYDYRWIKHRPKLNGLSSQLYRVALVNGDIYAIAYMYNDQIFKRIGDSDDDDDVVDKKDNDCIDDDDVDNEDDNDVDIEDVHNEDDDKDDEDEDDDDTNSEDDDDDDDDDVKDGDDVDNEEDDDTDIEDDDDDDGGDNTFFVRLKVSNDDDDGSSTSVVIEELSVGYPLSSIVYNMAKREKYYLVEVSGELYAIFIIARQLENLDGYDILKAFVSRWDMPKREWIQVESLGDRALLLCYRSCCTWCWAYESHGRRIEGNCIYVAEDIIHQYRLQDNSYTLVSFHSNFDSCSHGIPIWFMPRNPTRLPSLVEKAEQFIIKNTEHVELLEDTSAAVIPASSLLQLPPEIMRSIADRMHWFDCMNFRATCKIMRSVVPKPQWKANSPFPLFMFLRNTQGICELWDPCYRNNGSITKKFPYSPSVVSTIEFCKDDWLMLRSHEGCYLQSMNIFTGERCEYPTKSLPGGFGLSSFAFSTCPTSTDCLTVGIKCPYYLTISLLEAGEDEWKVFQFEFEDGDVGFRSIYKSSPKYHDGAFYFLGENGNLGVFKIIDGEWDLETHKCPLQNDDSSKLNECYIAELDGQVVCIFIQAFGFSIKVYNFDINQKLWVELKSLGNYTLFVSAASSLSVPTKDSSMRNRIYLPKRIGNEMVFYSLDTGKYHTSSSNNSFENFCGMNSQSFCCWV